MSLGRAVVFQSGFGPSGLPHLGTMGEVLRPSYVRHAFKLLTPDRSQRFVVFIDDMDGLRKVPENIPNRESFTAHLGKPVSRIPDPFGDCHDSFAAHMIALLGSFLAPVEVEYELMRSSEMYGGGAFDEALKLILAKHQEIIRIVTPTLREENRAGWSPVMPLCPPCGQINSTLVTAYHPDRGTVEFSCERSFGGAHGCGFRGEQSILGGHAKVQWKVDWALRWFVLKVDYELYGKDLIDSARLSGQILKLLGGRPPLGFAFEMYLDEDGHKVSKSVGRGVGVEQWRRYAPIEVLKYFLILNPRRARKLFLEAIPQYVDEYLDALREWSAADASARANSPLEFVLQSDSARRFNSTVTFSLVMNLVPALGTAERDLIWRYLTNYDPGITGDAETEVARAHVDGMRAEFLSRLYRAGQAALRPKRTRTRTTAHAVELARSQPGYERGRDRKGDLRYRPRQLRQAGQDLSGDLSHADGAGTRPAPRRVHPVGHPGENRTFVARVARLRSAGKILSATARVLARVALH